MRTRLCILLISVISILVIFFSCKKDPYSGDTSNGYPFEVGRIIETKCAVSGCHNDLSSQNAAQLNLTTWEKLVYEGGVSGSVVIPFKPEFSSLFQFCNTYEDLGLTAIPSMPINGEPLSREEIIILKDWIQDGCKNAAGEIPFDKDYESLKKVFFTNQGCDVTAVIDAETKLVMRYFEVGTIPGQIEVPHNSVASSDGMYIYVCFTANNIIQKINTNTNQIVATCDLGVQGDWNVIKLSQDNSLAYVSDLSNPGNLVQINTQSMTVTNTWSGLFNNPHGLAVKGNGDTIYLTAQYGNFFYRFIPAAFSNVEIPVVKGATINPTPNTFDPHEIIFSPEGRYYFLSCQSSNEVRVFDAAVDTLVKVIPTGAEPLEFAFSQNNGLLFVSCSEEPNPTFPTLKGSVDVIDINTLNVVHTIYGKSFQPHGLVVDESRDELWIGSRNSDPTGPAPHHTSDCGGRNGFFEVFKINTWQRVRGVSELSVDPYSGVIVK